MVGVFNIGLGPGRTSTGSGDVASLGAAYWLGAVVKYHCLLRESKSFGPELFDTFFSKGLMWLCLFINVQYK